MHENVRRERPKEACLSYAKGGHWPLHISIDGVWCELRKRNWGRIYSLFTVTMLEFGP